MFYKVVNNIKYKKKFPIKLNDAIKVVELIEAIKKSIKFKKLLIYKMLSQVQKRD